MFDTGTETRCYIDREQVRGERGGDVNVPGAIVGGVVGGVLGHQIGGGRGRDVATAGGAVAGAMVGANVGRDGDDRYTERQVEHCRDVPNAQPAYWDVEYEYGGKVFHTQLNYQPGPQIPVRVSIDPQ